MLITVDQLQKTIDLLRDDLRLGLTDAQARVAQQQGGLWALERLVEKLNEVLAPAAAPAAESDSPVPAESVAGDSPAQPPADVGPEGNPR